MIKSVKERARDDAIAALEKLKPRRSDDGTVLNLHYTRIIQKIIDKVMDLYL